MPGAEYIFDLMRGLNPTGSPPNDGPYVHLAARLRELSLQERRAELMRWIDQNDGDGTRLIRALSQLQVQSGCGGNGRIWTGPELLEHEFEPLPVVVGELQDALIVGGEIHWIAGPPGLGKTLFIFDQAIRLNRGQGVLGYPPATRRFLRILIFQSELSMGFVRARLERMLYGLNRQRPSTPSNTIRQMFFYDQGHPLFFDQDEGLSEIKRVAEQIRPDVIFIDPFLSFFGGDSENDNSGIRHALDRLKREVAQEFNSAVIITDHLTKTDLKKSSDPTPKARGAGAKIDVPSLVINLFPSKPPQGQEGGQFIKAQISKMRYGWLPTDPIVLRRDPETLRHEIWEPGRSDIFSALREILIENGGEISGHAEMLRLLKDRASISRRNAERAITRAEQDGLIEVSPGQRNRSIYRLRETRSSPENLNEDDEDENE